MSMKRIVSLFLCMALMLGNLGGISVFADSYENEVRLSQPADDEKEYEIVGSFSEGRDEFSLFSTSGISDDGISWSLEKGMLKLSGSGEMADYTADSVPWNEVKQSVKFIYVDDDITNIGDYAFYGLENAKSVYIPDSVTKIGVSAFEKCTELKEVVLSENLEIIGDSAFRECVKLKDITIPESVNSIGLSVFANCNKLKEIEVEEGNANYVSDDGVLFNKAKTVLLAFPGHNKNHKYTIPYGVTEIADFAFDTSVNLTEIILPQTLVKISAGAFNRCSGINKIDIPESVTEIAENAFMYGCSSLAELNVASGNTVYSSENGVLFNKDKTVLIRFPENCIKACENEKYTIPSTVKKIGDEAFFDCSTVKELYIHGGLTEIGRAAFMQFDSLTDIWFDGTKISWEMIPKGAFNEKLDEVTMHFVEANYQTTFTAELGLSYDIDKFVDFQGNEDLKSSAVITSSNPAVATIRGDKMYAMALGEAIVTAVLNRNGTVIAVGTKVTVVEQGSAIQTSTYKMVEGDTWDIKENINTTPEVLLALKFANWASTDERVVTVEKGLVTAVGMGKASIIVSLKRGTLEYKARCDITVTPKYTNEEYFTFYNGVITRYTGPDTVVKIPDQIGGIRVTEIGAEAFANCSHITQVVLPSTIKKIGNYAFRRCSNLSDIVLNEGLTTVKDYAFYYCTSLVKVTIPSTLTSNAKYWFIGCSRLNTVAFAEGTVTIYPVLRNSSVKKVILPESVKTISYDAFYGCSNLKTINIPKNVTSIGRYAFSNCTSLYSIDMSKATGLTSISDYAFYRCSYLQNIKFPPALKSIGYMSFCACYEITDITIPDSVTTIGKYAFENCMALETVKLGSGLTSLEYGAFYFCDRLETINIPKGVKRIESYTFYNCQDLKKIELPTSLTIIDHYAFYNCYDLKSVSMYDQVKTIGNSAFYGCRNLSQLGLSNTLSYIGNNAFYNCSSLANVTLPDSLISMGTYVFANCSALRTVKLGNNLSNLPAYTFYNCYNLTGIVIPDKVTSVGSYAFYMCSRLSDVTFGNGLKTINNYAFYSCDYLASVVLPDSVTSLGSYAFAYCRNISNLELSSGLIAVGYSAFYYCSGIKSVVIPSSVITIESYAFYNCSGITSIDLGESVHTIGSYSFYRCTSLKSVVIPDSMRNVYNYAFAYCTQLKNLSIGNNVTYVSPNAFYGCPLTSDMFDMENSHFIVSDDTNVGYIPLEVKYQFKDNANISDKKIVVTMPNSAFIVSGSMKLDGKEYDNYKERQGNGSSGNKITDIWVEGNSGIIKFCIKPSEYKTITVYADISCKSNVLGTKSERIGYVNCSLPEITISAADVTSQSNFIVEGMAIPNKTVSLYVDGELNTNAVSNASGNYKSYVKINNPENYRSYTVEARIQNSYGEIKTAETTIQYIQDNPTLTGLEMYYGQDGSTKKRYNLYGLIKPPVIAWGNYWNGSGKGYSYYFNVKLSNREDVDKVYVVSTKNGKKSYLEAKWDSRQQMYVTSGHFDGDYEYIPNVITVEFTKKIDDVKIALSEMIKYMDFGSGDVNSSITDFTTTSFSATVTVSKLLRNLFGDQIDISVDTAERDYSLSDNEDVYGEREGYYAFPVKENGLDCVISFDLSEPENAAVYIHDITNGKQTTYSMSFKQFDSEGNETNLVITDIFDKIDAYAGRMMNLYNLNLDMEKLIDGLSQTSLSDEQMLTLIKRAEQLNIKKKMFMLTTMVLTVSMMDNISAPAEILDILYSILNKDIRFFGELKLLITYKLGLDYKIRWVIDPSGYVYEGVTDNRLEGVTTTLYYIDNNDIPKNGEEYDFGNIDINNVKVWEADNYGQSNPLQTDASGKYSWMVPGECHYQVKYEKEGYETAYSEWLPVPPIQNDVNIGLVSTEAPKVENIYLTPEFMVIYFDKYMIPDTVKNISGIGDEYEISYDKTQKDLAGNNFAKEYVVKFKTKLTPESVLNISIADAQSYASTDMIEYSEEVTVADVENELSVSGVEADGTNLTVEYFNNTGDFLTYKAICAIYGEDDSFIGVRIQDVEKQKTAEKTKKLFVFEDEWAKYKIFAWSVENEMQPLMKIKDYE